MKVFTTSFRKNTILLIFMIGIMSVVSCGGGGNDGPDEDPIRSIQLVVDYTEMTLGGTISFSVFGNDGSNLTSSSTIYVDNSKISGSKFSSSSEGTYWFHASYNDIKSPSLSVKFIAGTLPGFKHKVLIEDYTGTWCGWCPRISYGIEQVEQHTDNVVVVSIHRLGSDPYKYTDDGIENLDEGQYPTGKINRTKTWPYPESSNTDFVLNLIENRADIGIALDSKINASSIDVTVSVATTRQYSSYKLVVYLVEDKLYHNQTNYTQFYNGADPIVDFEHNNVLRDVLTDIYGDVVYPTGDESQMTYSVQTPLSISNTDNVKVVAFVMDVSGEVLNAQVAKLGDALDFEN